MRKDSGMLPLWEPFSVFFCVVVYWGLLWHFRHAHTIHPFYFTYVHLYYHFVLFLEFPARFFFITFFHIDFLVFSVIFSFQFFVPFSLMIMFWYFFVLVYVQACSNLHQGSWLHPKDGVFFSHAQSKQRGCGCLRDYAKCYRSSKFSYVAFCCFIYYIIYTCLITYIYIT